MWNLRSLYLVNLFLLMAPRLARAGWGDERWGELVWSGAAPEVPLLLSPWLQGFLTALLLMTSLLVLRRRPRMAAWLIVAAIVAPIAVGAAQIASLPYSFVNGSIADANEVNADFGVLVAESNGQDLRLELLEDTTALHDSRLGILEALDPGDITGVAAGSGLLGGGTLGDVSLSVDTSYTQRRVVGTCPAGQSIRAIDPVGAVSCEPDDVGISAAAGDASYVNVTGDTITGVLTINGTAAVRPGVGGGFEIVDWGPGSGAAAGTQVIALAEGQNAQPQIRFQSDAGGGYMDVGSSAGGGFVIESNDMPRFTVSAGGAVWGEAGGSFQTLVSSAWVGVGTSLTTGDWVGVGTSLTTGEWLGVGTDLYVGGTSNLANVYSTGEVSAAAVRIRGGADIAEPFDFTGEESIAPGMVVSIDPAVPGRLRRSSDPYDSKVAGIVSGAGGVNPGLTLTQEGTIADGDHAVALTGRVYAWVDADANGAIRPGDLLTTSSRPGHAMRASDPARSHGAVLGKAMGRLDAGQGLVLTLVNLQ
ncbi:MAG: hypothetical protein KC616_10295 [Myxococcales bacterium]|nr:hypothetical protein [Myxococcales bacterium]